MVKYFCDICGKEITNNEDWSKYKVKREDYSWYEKWWTKLIVHDECWNEMCNYIKEKTK